MAVHLCDICRRFDVRALLALSEAQKPTSVTATLTGLLDVDTEFKSGVPNFHQHQKSLTDLEESSKSGCLFCKLIYESRSDKSRQSLVADKAIDDAGQGQLFIGTSGHNISKGEIPVIIVTQRPAGFNPRAICTFDVFSERGSVPNHESGFVCMPVASNSESNDCEVTALEWLNNCLTNHPLCGPSIPFRRPTRLINVGSKDGQFPRLEIDEIPSSVSWAALSYCWGGDSNFTLKSDTFEDLQQGFPLENFPKTLRDAIRITRNLNLQYLWIDALCILQDSASDWQAEATRMRDVYSGAVVTIIASESLSTSAGIYSARPPSTSTPVQLLWGDSDSKVWLRPSFRNAIDTTYTNPLQKRGWTLQEGLLASRTLSFRKDQMVWVCTNHQKTESGHTALLSHMFDSKDLFHNKNRKSKANLMYQDLYFGWCNMIARLEKQQSRVGWFPTYTTSSGFNIQDSLGLNPYTRWTEIIFEYSIRKFTKDTDILPALGGIARAFADITKDKYCAGMWESELPQSLCWRRQNALAKETTINGLAGTDLAKPTAYRAPSWSWASINGARVSIERDAVNYSLPIKNIATPIKVCIEPLGKDLFGQLRAGYIYIKGYSFQLGDLSADYWRNVSPSWEQFKTMPSRNKSRPENCSYPCLHAFALEKLNRDSSHTFEFEQQHIPHANQTFAAFLITHYEGKPRDAEASEKDQIYGFTCLLLLESTGNKDEFRRIGIITLNRPWELSIIDPSIDLAETKKWKDFDEEQWSRYEKAIQSPAVSASMAKAWIEVAKRTHKRITIRIV